jgi:nucleoside-diphosphate-sugar epimerase
MKRLLITGAYGLIGSNICKVLERDYPDIEITKVKCDELGDIVGQRFDSIIFASGYGQPLKFSEDKVRTLQIQAMLPDTLFRVFLKPKGSFLFISTSEVYSGAKPPHKETDIGTTTPQHPRACYIEGKRCGEAICMAYKEQGYDVKIARLALAYGEGTKKYDTRVINEFIEKGVKGNDINLMDEGSAIRTYCYVGDAVGMLLDILFKGKDCVYNVGGDSTISIKDLALKIGDMTKVNVTWGTSSGLVDAPADVRLDMTKTLSEFPRTFVSLDEGLKRTIEYQKQLYANNRN